MSRCAQLPVLMESEPKFHREAVLHCVDFERWKQYAV